MSTWIAWPPETPETRFPHSYWQDNPLEQFQGGMERETCPKCGFKVVFISDTHQFAHWNDHSHEVVAGILQVQREIGDCPSHPKPNWMV